MSRPSQPVFSRSSSSGNNLGDLGMSSVKRPSVQNSTSTFRGAFTPGGAAGRASVDRDRRSSVYQPPRATAPTAGGHQSFFQQAPQPAGVPKDPRPLKDRSYQNRIGQELLDYLTQNNFELDMNHNLSQNVIKSPTQKDFNYIFQWLYNRIDPSYRFMKNIDQEVPPLLKQLRYPYEKGITKSQIAAVGGQNWYTFLGVLHWMMQLAQMIEGFALNRYADACLEAGVDTVGDHITFDFLTAAYAEWLGMDDSVSEEEADKMLAPHIETMARSFEQANAKHFQELQILEAEHAKLLKEVEELEKSTPDPAILDSHFKIMEEDKIKFEEYNQLAVQRSEKYDSRIQVLQEELDKVMVELAEAEEERRSLQQAVDDQGISMQDIDRMASERERLQRTIETAAQRLEDVKRKVAEKEVEASAKLEELERMVDRYNTAAYQINLIPSTAANAKGRDLELHVTVNEGPSFSSSVQQQQQQQQLKGSYTGGNMENERLLVDPVTGYQPAHVLNLDLRGQVKNMLASMKKEISERRGVAMDTMMKDHDLLDSIKEAMEDKRNEVEALEHRVGAAEEEFEKTKEVTTAQRMASDAQIEKMEKELAKMRASLSESVQLLEQREMTTNIEWVFFPFSSPTFILQPNPLTAFATTRYEQLTLKANALREELHTEIMRMLNDVCKFKMHVQKSIAEYEGFVTEEVDTELGSNEMMDDTQNMDM